LNLTVPAVTDPGLKQRGHIFHVDEEEFVVAFVDVITRDHVQLNFRDAVFVVKERSVEASRPNEGRVVLEEASVC
jgi:hypothetical protein